MKLISNKFDIDFEDKEFVSIQINDKNYNFLINNNFIKETYIIQYKKWYVILDKEFKRIGISNHSYVKSKIII